MPEPGAHRADPFAETATAERGEPDYYAALGLHPDASDNDIRRAFHQLAKLWHPDRYMQSSPELRARAERRMRALVAAHEVLDDPIKRRAYDLRHGYADASAIGVVHTAHSTRSTHSAHPDALSRHAGSAAHASNSYVASDQASGTPGAGMFLALICAVLGLGVLARTLASPVPAPVAFIAYAIVLGLGALAAWSLMQDSAPTRMADHWMAYPHPVYPPPFRATPSPGHPHRAHRGSHRRHTRKAQDAQPVRRAKRADAEHVHTPPPETETETEFERLVGEALASVPSQFQPYMENVAVRVAAEPTEEQLKAVGVREGGTLLGLYEGMNLTHQSVFQVGTVGPEWITIFQGPIERYCRHNRDRIREQVRRTVLHELAHHFGIDHEDMPDWIR